MLHDPHLNQEFAENVLHWIEALHGRGISVEIKQTYVSPSEQAKLWKSGHPDSEVDSTIDLLESTGCFNIAKYIRAAKTIPGPCVTTLLPGCAWSNWGFCAFYTLKDIKTGRVYSSYDPVHIKIARYACKFNLFTGDRLRPLPLKTNIIQQHRETYPTDLWSLQEIDRRLQEVLV